MGDPYTNPLLPTVNKLEEYYEQLEYEGNQITIEWATEEMRGHQMNWVRLGLVAERVRRYRLYRPQYEDWNTYCKEVLGKRAWQMSQTIDCALVVMEIIKYGSTVYPTCKAQAQALIDCCKKTGDFFLDAWDKVVEENPVNWMLTANNICAALGFNPENNRISKRHKRKIQQLADRDGMTFGEKLDEFIALDEELEVKESQELEETEELDTEAQELATLPLEEQTWFLEMKGDVSRHDSQIWIIAALARLLPKPKSQFSWLRQARC